MNIVVTGGAGFIGSAVVNFLIEETHASVINVDKLTYASNPNSLAAVANSPRYHFEHVDICDPQALTCVFERHQPGAVINLAAESHVDRSIDGPAAFVQTNLVGTYQLLEAARGFWQGLPDQRADSFRFLHVSTDEVFGDLNDLAEARFSESTPYAPSSPYAATKAGSDHLVRAWGRTYGLPMLITNCSNNYGPRQFPEKLIPHVILNAIAGQPIPVYGKGNQIRDWLHVEDHARALWAVVQRGVVGETYNVGSSNEQQNIDVVRRVCAALEALGEKPVVGSSFAELIVHVEDRPGHDVRYSVNPEKIAMELGWRAQVTFEEGLLNTVRWYLDNRGWWERVLAGDYQLERLGGA